MTGWRILPMGEAAVLAECMLDDVAAANAQALALACALQLGFDILPAIRSVLVRFDPLLWTVDEVAAHIRQQIDQLVPTAQADGQTVVVPVRYGGEHGPDLDDAAQSLGLSAEALVMQHTAQAWRVLMIGFAPGFPYIGPLPASLTLSRRATPRPTVPAGSVAIAAGFTGIYPARLPGGWHLIGRTDLTLFDPMRQLPTLLQAGDRVQFVAV
ncbi:MAG: 5-oxoprolinase subunit PxpB [Anaerolineae bacterium]|nr:5-oxoprolinase subunit PxpB [Anaerolineae bacterium]